jgi:hypothetical protein
VLLVEARAYEETGLPLHVDNRSIFKERIYRDKSNPNILHDEMTSSDHALTRPWTVEKRYVHNLNPRAKWPEFTPPRTKPKSPSAKKTIF